MNFNEVVDIECWLEVTHRVKHWQVGQHRELELYLPVLDQQSLKALLAVGMEVVEQFGVFEGIMVDGTD